MLADKRQVVDEARELTEAHVELNGEKAHQAVQGVARRTSSHQAELVAAKVARYEHVRHARVGVLLPQVGTVAVVGGLVRLHVELAQRRAVLVQVVDKRRRDRRRQRRRRQRARRRRRRSADGQHADQAAEVERARHAVRHVGVDGRARIQRLLLGQRQAHARLTVGVVVEVERAHLMRMQQTRYVL